MYKGKSLCKKLFQQMPSTHARTSTIGEPSVSPEKSRKSGTVWGSNFIYSQRNDGLMRNLLNIFPSARFHQILFVLHKTPHEKNVTTFASIFLGGQFSNSLNNVNFVVLFVFPFMCAKHIGTGVNG
jgi:hypothetical protein